MKKSFFFFWQISVLFFFFQNEIQNNDGYELSPNNKVPISIYQEKKEERNAKEKS